MPRTIPSEELKLFYWAFRDAHPDVFSLTQLNNGMWSVRLKNGLSWPPAAHGFTPEQAYERALVDRVTRKLEQT